MKSRFSEYSQISIPVTGRQVAEQMLKDNHITDVKVISTPGHLTDHYNPADKTVNLKRVRLQFQQHCRRCRRRP